MGKLSNKMLKGWFTKRIWMYCSCIVFISIHLILYYRYFYAGFNNLHLIDTAHTNDARDNDTIFVDDDNKVSNCYQDIHGYKYINMLLQKIKYHRKMNKTKQMYTTKYIDQHLRDKYKNKNNIRIKYYNGKLYEDQFDKRQGYKPLYRQYFIYLFQEYIQMFNISIPNFDAIIYTADYDAYFNWKKGGILFNNFGDFKYDTLQLLTVPRSILKLYFDAHKDWKLFQEYCQYSKYSNFTKKAKINQFFMRCTPRTQMRQKVVWFSNHGYDDKYGKYYNMKLTIPRVMRSNKTKEFGNCLHWYFNEKSNCWDYRFTSIKEEMRYKYIVSIDGIATRDALTRTIQYNYSVNIMYNSSKFEFWHLDLINNYNIIKFNDEIDFLRKTKDIIDNKYPYDPDKIAKNAQIFSKHYLNLNNVNCFVMEMFKIYTKYFFNSSSVSINSSTDVLLTR